MKGHPALRTVLVLLLLAAVFYPVSRVISHRTIKEPTPVAVLPSGNKGSLSGILRIRTAPTPLRLEVSSEGRSLPFSKDTTAPGCFAGELSVPAGSDLVLRAEWPDDHPHALHAEFLSEGGNAPVSRDYWAGRTLEDVLSLP